VKRKAPEDSENPLRRFVRPPRTKPEEADPVSCRNLRARASASSAAGGPYWCLKTMRSEGPDGMIVQPEECTDERSCFEPARIEGRG
jgi:hypothetical protein